MLTFFNTFRFWCFTFNWKCTSANAKHHINDKSCTVKQQQLVSPIHCCKKRINEELLRHRYGQKFWTKLSKSSGNILNEYIRLLTFSEWEPFVLAARGLGVGLGGLAWPEPVEWTGGKGAHLQKNTTRQTHDYYRQLLQQPCNAVGQLYMCMYPQIITFNTAKQTLGNMVRWSS